MRLRYTPQARTDLREIQAYLTGELANPQAAARTAKQLLQSCQRLKLYPQLGPALTEKIGRETNLRYLVSGNYLIFYRAEAPYVSVLRILDGRTDYLRVLFSGEL